MSEYDTVEKSILLIDDDRNLLTTLSDFLRYEGYDVTTAERAEEGLELLAGMKPDLIILDMSMPGMGGIGFLKALSSRPDIAGIPVYVFTARLNMESFFEEMDIAGFMGKPCDPNELLDAIQRILAKGRKTDPAHAGQSANRVSGRILIAEDEAGRRETLTRIFSDAGFETVIVSSGLHVVEKAIAEKPDLLLLKLVMESMNGDSAAIMLSEMPSTRDIPVVLYDDTGTAPSERLFRAGGGATRRLCSSAKPADLLKTVQSVLNE